MQLKYIPQQYNPYATYPDGTLPDTEIVVIDANTISSDGKELYFDPLSVQWDSQALYEASGGMILEAHRDNGELCISVLRRYTGSCSEWDNGLYNQVTT